MIVVQVHLAAKLQSDWLQIPPTSPTSKFGTTLYAWYQEIWGIFHLSLLLDFERNIWHIVKSLV